MEYEKNFEEMNEISNDVPLPYFPGPDKECYHGNIVKDRNSTKCGMNIENWKDQPMFTIENQSYFTN